MDNVVGYVKSALYFLTVLSILVLVHEWGHFIVAKWCRMRVDDFSLFFGKVLFNLGERNGTKYHIRSIPLGGFVKIAGMEPDDISNGAPLFRRDPKRQKFAPHLRGLSPESLENVNFDEVSERVERAVENAVQEGGLSANGKAELQSLLASASLTTDEHRYVEAALVAGSYVPDPDGYNQKPIWQRAAVIFAGPFMSLAFGYVLLCGMGMTGRLPDSEKNENVVASIDKSKPAYKAGLRPDDKIVKINDTPISEGDTMMDMIHENANKPLTLTVLRDKDTKTLQVTPQPSPEPYDLFKNGKPVLVNGEQAKGIVGLIGFSPRTMMVWKHYTPAGAIVRGTDIIKNQVFGTLIILSHPKLAKENVGGPVRIVGIIHENSKEGPWRVMLTGAILSISLGIMNLLPIPVLDGGHLMLLAVEAIRRRRLTVREIYTAQLVGLSIIGLLFVLVMYNDIMSFFPHK